MQRERSESIDVVENMNDGELIAYLGTDAERWALAFDHYNPTAHMDPSPGEALHGWFCNAIEAGRSAGYAQAKREAEPDWPEAADA